MEATQKKPFSFLQPPDTFQDDPLQVSGNHPFILQVPDPLSRITTSVLRLARITSTASDSLLVSSNRRTHLSEALSLMKQIWSKVPRKTLLTSLLNSEEEVL